MSDPDGFSEAPQAPFEGKPLSGDVSAWAEEIEAEAQAGPQGLREDVAQEAERQARSGKPARSKAAKAKNKPKPIIGEKRTGGGTIIGGSNDVKERVAAGLNPVAGLDVSAEDALATRPRFPCAAWPTSPAWPQPSSGRWPLQASMST